MIIIIIVVVVIMIIIVVAEINIFATIIRSYYYVFLSHNNVL